MTSPRTLSFSVLLSVLLMPLALEARTLAPIQIKGNQFIPHLRGGVSCCDNPGTFNNIEGWEDGWPLALDAALDRIAASGANLTYFRTGPFIDADEPPIWRAGDPWKMLDHLRARVTAANQRGLYVMIDLVDHWALYRYHRSPFMTMYPGVPDTCDVTLIPPHPDYLRWVDKIVEETGDLAVLYSLGNEAYKCSPSQAWENGLFARAKAKLAEMGVHRPVGRAFTLPYVARPNAPETPSSPDGFDAVPGFDFRAFGQFTPTAFAQALDPANDSTPGKIPLDIPALMTEDDSFTGIVYTPAEWQSAILAAENHGGYVMVWRGNMLNFNFQAAMLPPVSSCDDYTPTAAKLRYFPLPTEGGVCRALVTVRSQPALKNGQAYAYPLSNLHTAGACGIPPNARAVAANVTVMGASTDGALRISPGCSQTGRDLPDPWAMQFDKASLPRTSNAILPLSSSGRIALEPVLTMGAMEVALDITGYFAQGPTGNDYTPLVTPARLVDNRVSGPSMIAGQTQTFDIKQLLENAGVPSAGVKAFAGSAIAQYFDFTPGVFRLWAKTDADPVVDPVTGLHVPQNVTTVSYHEDESVGNGGIFPLRPGAGDDLAVWSSADNPYFILDATGYFSPTLGQRYRLLNRCRLATDVAVTADGTRTYNMLAATGTCPALPADAKGVLVNLTVKDAGGHGYVTAFPVDDETAAHPAVHYKPNQTIGNTTIVKLDSRGRFRLRTLEAVTLTVDVLGYFQPAQ